MKRSCMRRVCLLLSIVFFTVPTSYSSSPEEKLLLGFSSSRSVEERVIESRFDSTLQRSDLRGWMKQLSARPHNLGSSYDKTNADFIASLFRSWGFDVAIEEFSVLFPTPKPRLFKMIGPDKYEAVLAEPRLNEDSTSGHQHNHFRAQTAHSITGDVTGVL